MATRLHRALLLCVAALLFAPFSFASAYDGRPRLIVIVIVDQLRGDFLERSRARFGAGGFNLFLERGAVFTDCRYDYANTHTAPGHATLLTGAYPDGHGIAGNQWWDPEKQRVVTSVEDETTQLVGLPGAAKTGASPRNLLASTLGDVLKMATGGKSRVFAVALKDRSAILPAGFAGNGAYWIDRQSGAFLTSTYYANELPAWVKRFNESQRAEKYWNREWKDASGKTLRSTAPGKARDGSPERFFYDVVGATPFATDYQLEFARELVVNEKLGSGPATDLLIVGLTAPDILGHEAGPDSPQIAAMVEAMDAQLAAFFQFLGKQVGPGNFWLALSADHGIAPLPSYAARFRIPAGSFSLREAKARANAALSAQLSPGRPAEFIRSLDWPFAYLSPEAFSSAKLAQAEAERAAGEVLMKESPAVGYFTRSQIARGELPPGETARRYAHSAAPTGGWYVILVPQAYVMEYPPGTTHSSPYTYDTHVPLAFYGAPFQPGTYRGHSEPVDLAPTLASLLGISPPSHSVGRVLTEALSPAPRRPPRKAPR